MCLALKLRLIQRMAPLAMEQITENMAARQEQTSALKTNTNEQISRANMAAAGSFFIGFSAAAAFCVKYSHLMPRGLRNFVAVPSLLGLCTAAHIRHTLTKDMPAAKRSLSRKRRPIVIEIRLTK